MTWSTLVHKSKHKPPKWEQIAKGESYSELDGIEENKNRLQYTKGKKGKLVFEDRICSKPNKNVQSKLSHSMS